LESLGEKHLIKDQMFGSWQTAVHSPPPATIPIYISWLHQRLRTIVDILGRDPRIRHVTDKSPEGAMLSITDQKLRGSNLFGTY
jgi:hypothetical protein